MEGIIKKKRVEKIYDTNSESSENWIVAQRLILELEIKLLMLFTSSSL